MTPATEHRQHKTAANGSRRSNNQTGLIVNNGGRASGEKQRKQDRIVVPVSAKEKSQQAHYLRGIGGQFLTGTLLVTETASAEGMSIVQSGAGDNTLVASSVEKK